MWVSELANGCGLRQWQTNSRIVRVTAPDIGTPFQFHSETLGAFSHNAMPLRAPATHAVVLAWA